ncbi:hybrid sensor histidine kinase/response regulator transcription factor [Arsenicibacter rosenii]|uniref:histidine kinase n=1 Tax=Arsenicibacter rosenii TaxID=1750698 RepID=A0A1S2VFC9_9BACT|nr:ATP-binding protein [Arsenicibacter rosenii]OIN57461.1 hypothetical protein BLX24_19725 [Arsenicibacter rosenii]
MAYFLYYCRQAACLAFLLVVLTHHALVLGQGYAESVTQATSPASDYIFRMQFFGQQPGFDNRNVLAIGQDKAGLIWTGTMMNAYRFDGTRFMPLPAVKPVVRRPSTLVFDVTGMDQDGNQWFFNSIPEPSRQITILPPGESQPVLFDSLFKKAFPLQHEAIQPATRESSDPATATLRYIVTGTKNPGIWEIGSNGSVRLVYRLPAHTGMRHLHQTRRGTLLATVSDLITNRIRLLELSPKGQLLRQRPLPAQLAPIHVDEKGAIYLYRKVLGYESPATWPHLEPTRLDRLLYRLSPTGELSSLPITLPAGLFQVSAQDNFADIQATFDASRNLFWVKTRTVLFAWHPEQGVIFDDRAAGPPLATATGLTSLFIDRTGSVWVGASEGLFLITAEKNQFRRYLYTPTQSSSFPSFAVRGILQLGNELWVNSSTTQRVNLTTNAYTPLRSVSDPDNYPVRGLYPMLQGKDGFIWSGARSLVRIEPGTRTSREYMLPTTNYVYALWQDERQILWVGTESGLSLFDPKTGQSSLFRQYNRFPELAHNAINGFFPDKQAGGVWIAASSGLYLLDTRRGIVARYSDQRPAPYQLPASRINWIHADHDEPGVYWLATRGEGLIRWDKRTGQTQVFTQQQGLPDNTIYSIDEDAKNRLWLPTNAGLVCFRKNAPHQVQIYLPKDGIAHEEFNLMARWKAGDGQLFLGGLNGITAFRPDRVGADIPQTSPLLVTNFQLLDTKTGLMVDTLSLFLANKQIQLQPTDRSFVLSFAIPDYRFTKNARLWYRIRGWQDTWAVQSGLDLPIIGLPPGTYHLETRVQAAGGQWLTGVLAIPVVALAPFYQQLWFYLACLVVSLLAGAFFIRWRTQKLIARNEQLEAEVLRRTKHIEADKILIEQQSARLKENAELKTRFFTNVTHEFRTPLTLLLGPISYLARQITDPTAAELLTVMKRNANQLLSLVNNLLDLTKAEAGQILLMEKPTDVPALIRQQLSLFAAQAAYNGIQLKTDICQASLWCLMDAEKVDTILKNLIANALRFTKSGGQITLFLTTDPDTIRISVQDTGMGIHPGDLPFIFERYYQSTRAEVPLQGGTGIGLAIAADFCRLWGGQLTVESAPGIGSTFTLTYPLQPVAAPILPTAPEALPVTSLQPAGADSHRNKIRPVSANDRILIVEDNLDMAAYISSLLAPHYQTRTAANGQLAIDCLTNCSPEELPQLIITDMMMPELDGLGLIGQLRSHPTLTTIPLMMLTARTDTTLRLKILELGVADFLTKPFVGHELLTRIENLLERSREQNAWQLATDDRESPARSKTEPEVNWLITLEQHIQANLSDTDFRNSSLAELIHVSERQLYRLIKVNTGFTPNQFIQEIRLQSAREWLENGKVTTVKEACYAVGFQQVSYFSRIFQQRFGVYPSEIRPTKEPTGV